jgi:hypothetical protein
MNVLFVQSAAFESSNWGNVKKAAELGPIHFFKNYQKVIQGILVVFF